MRNTLTGDYNIFFRMGVSTYDLLQMAVSFVEREGTVVRNSIPAIRRLSATLRFLATGQTFEDLKFTTVTEPQTLSGTPLFFMCLP
jgi:hypothetical protein